MSIPMNAQKRTCSTIKNLINIQSNIIKKANQPLSRKQCERNIEGEAREVCEHYYGLHHPCGVEATATAVQPRELNKVAPARFDIPATWTPVTADAKKGAKTGPQMTAPNAKPAEARTAR